MGLSITNSPQLGAINQYQTITRALNKSIERLATGKKVNRASDDPAGSVAIDKFKAEKEGLKKKIDGLEFEANYLGAREGAKSVVSDLLTNLSGLVVQAANTGANTPEERKSYQIQVDSIIQTIDYLSLTSRFNNQALLEGQQASQLGRTEEVITNPDSTTTTKVYSLASLATGQALNLEDGNLEKAQTLVRGLVTSYAAERAVIGARAKQIDSELRVTSNELINVTDAQSRIEDVDYAAEVSQLIRNQVLQQAAEFAIKLAGKSRNSTILDLLKF